jgi:RNA polymerase sigma-70 factor (ECF subfamily)
VETNPAERARWFAEEVHQHEAALRGYLHNTFPSLDVDDVVQESYLKLLRARTAGHIASTKSYLFAVARNTALTLFHRRRIFSPTPVNELPDSLVLMGEPDAAQTLAASERFDLMCQAIAQLPERCRAVMCLAALRGFSNAEIATTLGLAENTVRVHLARGIRQCARYLREQGEGR